MKTVRTRFGEVEYDPDNLLNFPAGMIGFPTLRNFIVMPNQKDGIRLPPMTVKGKFCK